MSCVGFDRKADPALHDLYAAKGERFIKDIVPPEVLHQCVEAVKTHRAQLRA
jgi:hypothetical protein